MSKGYGLFGELTLEGYVGEQFGVDLRKREAPGGGTVLKVSPKAGQTGITSGVFEVLSERYTFVGVRITEFGTFEATFDPKPAGSGCPGKTANRDESGCYTCPQESDCRKEVESQEPGMI